MHKIIKSVKKSFFLLFIFEFTLFANPVNLDFYGIITTDADSNMMNMTEDMFIKQLSEITTNVTDKRTEKNNLQNVLQTENSNTIFYIDIKKIPNTTGKWSSVFYIKNPQKKTNIYTKEYDSYYKILVESKYFLSEIFSNNDAQKNKNQAQSTMNFVSTEKIAGTWIGEKFVNKIVILRGGRGFVIFNNGASMNISINIQTDSSGKNYVNIKQTSSANASFFPEIPRKNALEIASNTEPIEWNLSLFDENILKGEKHTITLLEQSNTPQKTTIPVEWKKVN